MRQRLHSTVPTVIGLDLSATGSAACALPLNWGQDINRTRTMLVGYKLTNETPEEEMVDRLEVISQSIGDFVQLNKGKHVGVEQYAFSQMQSRAHLLGEVGGTVKLEVRKRLKITARPIVAAQARKTLLQHLPSLRGMPKGYMKKFVVHNVKRLGGPTLKWSDDEIDAFVIANHMLMLAGGTAITFEGEEP